jgi:hypothetical protein
MRTPQAPVRAAGYDHEGRRSWPRGYFGRAGPKRQVAPARRTKWDEEASATAPRARGAGQQARRRGYRGVTTLEAHEEAVEKSKRRRHGKGEFTTAVFGQPAPSRMATHSLVSLQAAVRRGHTHTHALCDKRHREVLLSMRRLLSPLAKGSRRSSRTPEGQRATLGGFGC